MTSTATPTRNVNPLAVEEGAKPSVTLLLGVFLAHVVIWIGLIAIVPGDDRVSFEFLGDQSTPWFRQFVIPLLVVLAFQAVVITKLGWWSSVLRDPSRTSRTWLWIPVGGFVAISMIGSLAGNGWNDAGAAYVIGVAITVMLVGITEELTFRGVIQVGARRIFTREWHAVAFASALFGLFHLPNSLLGSPIESEIPHVFVTAVIGLAFYALRRLTGTIIVPMIVHGIWDLVVLQTNWDAIVAAAS